MHHTLKAFPEDWQQVCWIACVVAFTVTVAVISGRRRKRMDWAIGMLLVIALATLSAIAGTYAAQYYAWKRLDNLTWERIEELSPDPVIVEKKPDYVVYKVDLGGDATHRVNRYSFKPSLLRVVRPGIFVGVAVGALGLTLRHFIVRWMGDRLRAGHCSKCGYNLTGNTSGVCPECGSPNAAEDGVAMDPQ